MSNDPANPAPDMDDMQRRLDTLERQNAGFRRQLKNIGLVSDNPNFDLAEFNKALGFYTWMTAIPMMVVFAAMALIMTRAIRIPMMPIGPLPLIDPGGYFGLPGMGVGIVAFGGLAVGLLAVGGCAVGAVAIGGCAIGIVAMGGGAFGIFAYGGGAIGVIAMGGGAVGYYALGGDAKGKYAFGRRRQDPEAVEFWTQFFPRLKLCVAGPMPVIPLDTE